MDGLARRSARLSMVMLVCVRPTAFRAPLPAVRRALSSAAPQLHGPARSSSSLPASAGPLPAPRPPVQPTKPAARPKGVRRPRRPSAGSAAQASTSTSTVLSTSADGVKAGLKDEQPEYPPSLSVFLRPDPELENPTLPLTASVGRAADQANKIPLPYLAIPLGVKERPVPLTGASLSNVWSIKDPAKKSEAIAYQRKILTRQMQQPYYYDLHAMRSHGGKIWRGPPTMIREDQALYFPDVMGMSLQDRSSVSTTQFFQGNISVVAVLTSRLSSDHVQSFLQPNLDRWRDTPGFQFVQINVQQNMIKSYLVSLFLSSLRKETPPAFQPSYIFARQNMELLRPRLGLHNQYVGYVYLVDANCKIRWTGCAFAEQEERESLWTSVGVLMDRLTKKSPHHQTRQTKGGI